MNHYDTLGVPKDADKATIKKAYRKKSSKAHPDKGGSDKQMAVINKAYDTLMDDEKRARHDSTGEDGMPKASIEDRARTQILYLFNQAMQACSGHEDIIEMISDSLKADERKYQARITEAEKHRSKLKKIAKRIKGGDMFKDLLAMQEAACDNTIAVAKEMIEVNDKALKMLDGYEMEMDADYQKIPPNQLNMLEEVMRVSRARAGWGPGFP